MCHHWPAGPPRCMLSVVAQGLEPFGDVAGTVDIVTSGVLLVV